MFVLVLAERGHAMMFSRFALQHSLRFAGATYAARDGYNMYAVEYGALRSVERACNYSYREFWF